MYHTNYYSHIFEKLKIGVHTIIFGALQIVKYIYAESTYAQKSVYLEAMYLKHFNRTRSIQCHANGAVTY